MSGYAAIGLFHPKSDVNVGSVLRAAGCFGVSMVAVGGFRVRRVCTDTGGVVRKIPVLQVEDLRSVIPYDCVPVAVELLGNAQDLRDYVHPERAFYVFGPEDGSLGRKVTNWCRDTVMIPTIDCLNLAATVNVVLYDRLLKLRKPPGT